MPLQDFQSEDPTQRMWIGDSEALSAHLDREAAYEQEVEMWSVTMKRIKEVCIYIEFV